MAEPVIGGNGSKPTKEMSMEVRLLLAFVLMGAVMFVSQYFFKSQTPPAAQKTAQSSEKSSQKSAAAATVVPPKAIPPSEPEAKAAPAPGATPEQPLPPLVIDTDLYRVTLSNQGGTVRSWLLKKYKGNDNKPLELLNTASGLEFPFSLYFPDKKPGKDVNWAWFTQTADPDGLGVSYQYSDGHTSVRKSFKFEKNSFLSKISTEVTLDGKPLPHMIEWRGGFGDLTIANPAANQRTLYFDVAENKLREKTARDAKSGPVTASGNFSFAGIADTYFAAVFLPEGNNKTVEVVTLADTVKTPVPDEKPAPFPGVAISDGA